jgi:hypothetical protein
MERLESTNQQQSLDVIFLEQSRNDVEARFGGQLPIGTDLGTALGRPAVDFKPLEVAHCAKGLIVMVAREAGEAVVDGDGVVAARHAVGDGGAGGGVHASGWGTDVDDADAHLLLV